jgi:hypothetical protein
LKGPAGCGKTATLAALAQEMDFEIIEWLDLSQNYALLEEDKSGDFARYSCMLCILAYRENQTIKRRSLRSLQTFWALQGSIPA